MLGKLINYEFKNLAKLFLPLNALVLLVSSLSRFSLVFADNNLMSIFIGLSFMLYGLTLLACNVGVFVLQVASFYKTTFGDQGYLSHTLPVKGSSLLFSKLLVAGTWTILSAVVTLVSVYILSIGFISWNDITIGLSYLINAVSTVLGMPPTVLIIIAVILSILGAFASYIIFFSAIIIGHRFGKHKILGAIASYIGIYVISQTINSVYFLFFSVASELNDTTYDLYYYSDSVPVLANTFLWPLIIINFAIYIALYIVSHKIMNKKVDLD